MDLNAKIRHGCGIGLSPAKILMERPAVCTVMVLVIYFDLAEGHEVLLSTISLVYGYTFHIILYICMNYVFCCCFLPTLLRKVFIISAGW